MSSSRLVELEKFLEREPDDPFTQYAIALEYASEGDLATALTKLETLISMKPTYVAAYQQLGAWLIAKDQINRARDVLKRGIEVATSNGEAHARNEMQTMIDDLDV